MSPILVRPVREQFEHDRVIRLLQARWRRRFQVAVNLGAEQTASAGNGTKAVFPDLVLTGSRSHRLEGLVEVETSESVNHLEAMAQWARFAALRVPFYLYVPSGSVEAARRLCTEHAIPVAEIWSYYSFGDQMRFTLIYKAPPVASRASGRPEASAPAAPGAASRAPASGGGPKEAGVSGRPRRAAATGRSGSKKRTSASQRATEKKTAAAKRLADTKRRGAGSRDRSGKRGGAAKRSAEGERHPNVKRGRRPRPAARTQKRK